LPSNLDVFDDLVITSGFPLPDDMKPPPGKVNNIYGSANRQLSAPWRDADRIGADGVAIGGYGTSGGPGVFAIFANASCPTMTLLPAAMIPKQALQLERTADTFTQFAELDSCATKELVVSGLGLVTVHGAQRDMLLGLASPTMIDTGVTTETYCGLYAWAVSTKGAEGITQRITCTNLMPDIDKMHPAYKTLSRPRSYASVDGTLLLVGETTPREVDATRIFQWVLEATDGSAPKLTAPKDVAADVKTAFPDAGIEYCVDATTAELGRRDSDAGNFGDGREIVFACKHGDQSSLFARFAGPKRDAIPHVEYIGPIKNFFFVDIEAGDVTGDGLDDIVVRDVTGKVELFRQCDAHEKCDAPVDVGQGTKQ
jgi:hypothetical protein